MAEKEIIKGVKRWIKTHDPKYIAKRKANSEKAEVRLKRQMMNKKRRDCAANVINLLKHKTLKDHEDYKYTLHKHKVIRKKYGEKPKVFWINKRAEEFEIEIEDMDELDQEKYDMPIFESDKDKVREKVKALLSGDEEIEREIRSVKKVSKETLTDDECYWKSLSEKEKDELINKL